MKNKEDNKLTYYLITIILTISIIVPIILYYANFHDYNISKNSNDWANFSTYISGIVTPIISIISVIVLLKVNESVKQSNFNIYNRYKRLRKKIRTMDFTIELPKNLSFEKRMEDLRKYVEGLSSNIEIILNNEDDLKNDIAEICSKNGINENVINDIFRNHDCFESKCLAIPNFINTIGAYLILAEITHYKELAKVDKKSSYEEKLKFLSIQLEKYLEEHQLTD